MKGTKNMKKQTNRKSTAKNSKQKTKKKVVQKSSDQTSDQIRHNITGGTKEVYHYSMEDGRCSGSVGSGGLCG